MRLMRFRALWDRNPDFPHKCTQVAEHSMTSLPIFLSKADRHQVQGCLKDFCCSPEHWMENPIENEALGPQQNSSFKLTHIEYESAIQRKVSLFCAILKAFDFKM